MVDDALCGTIRVATQAMSRLHQAAMASPLCREHALFPTGHGPRIGVAAVLTGCDIRALRRSGQVAIGHEDVHVRAMPS